MKHEKTLLMVVDYQTRLLPVINNHESVTDCAIRMIDVFNILELPIIVTEQYPHGLGETLSDIKAHLKPETPFFEKTQFSAMTESVKKAVKDSNCKHLVLIGVETHVCVYQTAKDLIEAGYAVSVVYDAVSSRHLDDRRIGFEAMRQCGAMIKTCEMVIYELMKDSRHPKFKEILKVVK